MKRASAHSAITDEGINATLHIDPNDHPVTGVEAKFYFTFQDPSGQFNLQQCDCKIVLLKDEQEIERQPVSVSDSTFALLGSTPLFTKTFSESGEYELLLSGAPKNGGVFQSFDLDFDFQIHQSHDSVMQTTDHHSFATEHIGHIVIFSVGLVAAIFLLVRNYYKNRKQNN